MKALYLFCLELGRLFQSRLTWLVILLTVLSPLAGLVLYKPTAADTMLSMYLADPALAGGVVGGILFGLLTVYELDRTERSRVGMLMDAAVSPLTMALVRLPALAAAAVLGLGLTMLVWLPISRELIGSVFGGTDYLLSYLLFMGLALWLAILAAAAAYQFTRRSDLSLVLFAAFAALSLTILGGGAIHDFALTMSLGVFIGTFSSVFVSNPILLLLGDTRQYMVARKKVEYERPGEHGVV